MDSFQTIDRQGTAEFRDRGSRFIAFAFPVKSPEEFKPQLAALKKEHPKAVHHCFAYRCGIDGNTFRSSDDGEPSGSAGKPILGQIDSKGLTDVAVVVVRYFGGTLLGIPGLINAYKTVTSLALQMVPVVVKPIEVPYMINFGHAETNEVMRLIKNMGGTVIEQELGLFPYIKAGIPKARVGEFEMKATDLRNVSFTQKL